jgi:hypothetical protein
MWTEEKLNQYITDKVEESSHLDYKASGSLDLSGGQKSQTTKKNEIAKDVSAFANSDGGTIIYGISEFQEGTTHLPEKIEPIDRAAVSKETLERIISTRISPTIQDIKITPVPIGDEMDNKVVYVVEIPKGNTAHQSSDKRYYRRYNFESIMMEDWEIKDIINRQTKGMIKVHFRPNFDLAMFDLYIETGSVPMSFDILASNVCNKVIKYCDVRILGRSNVAEQISPQPDMIRGASYFELYYSNEEIEQAYIGGEDVTVHKSRSPILPLTFINIGEIVFLCVFFMNDNQVAVTVSMDDNRTSIKSKIREHLLDIG